MSYQPVRGAFEKLTYDALRVAGIPADQIFFDGVGETPPGPAAPYATVSMSFTDTTEDVIGCGPSEHLRGSVLCNVYTPKNRGSKPGEDICLEVIKEWQKLGKHSERAGLVQASTRNITGPTTVRDDARPHHINSISCAWAARVA